MHPRSIEHHRRNDDGSWTMREHRAGELVTFTGVAATIAVDDVYRDPLDGA